jgi:hypothetical protein
MIREPAMPANASRRSGASRTVIGKRSIDRSYASVERSQWSARSKPSGRSKRSAMSWTSSTAGHAVRPELAVGPAHQVPDAAFQHEPERIDVTLDDAAALATPVAHQDRPLVPDRRGEDLEMGQVLRRVEPAGGVEVEALGDAAGPSPELRRQRSHDLQAGRGHDRPEAQLRGRTGQTREEHRFGLVGGQAGQPGPVAVDEADAAVRAALGVDRHAGFRQRLDVAVDRPDGHLELLGELRRRHPAAGLEQEQDVDQAAGAHRHSVHRMMTSSVRYDAGGRLTA